LPASSLSTTADEPDGLGEGQRIRRVIRRELPERVSRRGDDHVADGVAHSGPRGRAVGEERRLRVVRQRQLVGRTLEREERQWDAERGVGGFEDLARGRKARGEVLPHPRCL
jgi:hypothetical protein